LFNPIPVQSKAFLLIAQVKELKNEIKKLKRQIRRFKFPVTAKPKKTLRELLQINPKK